MKDKLTKVYAAEVNFPEKIETGIGIFHRNYTIMYRWVIIAVFSTKKDANKHIHEKNYAFADEVRGERIIEWEIDDEDIVWYGDRAKVNDWRVDYEIYFEEWNKLQEVKKI